MKVHQLIPSLLVALVAALAAEQGVSQTTTEPARGQRQGRNDNRNDAFYRLGPDSLPMDGVPKGKYSEPAVIRSEVYPGTQHTYWVYVPAQYDPSRPTAIMIFDPAKVPEAANN